MADSMYERTGRACCQRREQVVPVGACGGAHPDLDEFMGLQRLGCFGDHGLSQARLADHDDGSERMGEAAQVPALLFAELHDDILQSGEFHGAQIEK